MPTSYDVRIWSVQTRYKTVKGKRIPSRYLVRWGVAGARFDKTFQQKVQADSFRSDLLSSANKGEPFDTAEGLPMWMMRKTDRTSWLDLARSYVDTRWSGGAPKSRESTAEYLLAITRPLLAGRPGEPDPKLIGAALRREFNTTVRARDCPPHLVEVIGWIERASPEVADLTEPAALRRLIAAMERRRDGRRCATDTLRLRRLTLQMLLAHAVEQKILTVNPLTEIKLKRQPAALLEVDRRSVVNPMQARTLLLTVQEINPRLVAFFAVLYYAALRPEEAVNLRRHNIVQTAGGWELHLTRAAPEVAARWTDDGVRGEERELKHRSIGASRIVPCVTDLATHLHAHLREHGTTPDGRLFRSMRSDAPLSSSTYGYVWARTRAATFTPEVVDSPLARRPYDLRHAGVSTWLNATGDPSRVAEWAGHSVGVLLRVYAKCIDGGEAEARRDVERRLSGS